MNILVFSENDDVVKELLSGFRDLKGSDKVTLFTYSDSDFTGFADKVVKSSFPEDIRLEDHAVSTLSELGKEEGFDLIAVGSTRRGKEIAPRVAQRLGFPCVTDVIGVYLDTDLEVERYSLSGRTIAREKILRIPAVLSVMPRTFEITIGNESPEVIERFGEAGEYVARVIGRRKKEKSGVELEKAEIVIGLGRGIGGKEGIEKAMKLKEVLGGEIGSTRPVAYDYGWLPEETMIGLSGKRTKPSLYIAIGVSGQIQHMTGVMNARRIVAINKDENAPIFEYADYGIVGEWRDVLPKLIEAFRNR
jgi:electron transfer flavoprotein alpha subunit